MGPRPGRPGPGIRLTLGPDTGYLSLADGEALIGAIEEIPVTQADAVTADLFPEVVGILRTATGEGAEWASALTPESRLEQDLQLESIEILVLGDALRERYGVDLPAHLARLDIDELIALTVGDLVALCRG